MEIVSNPLFSGFLLTGFIFMVSGMYMKKHPPKNINSLYGYRTNSSMKSQERWNFAQLYAAKQLIHTGIALCLISLLGLLCLYFFSLNMPVSLIIFSGIVLFCSVAMIIKVQTAIKKKFGA